MSCKMELFDLNMEDTSRFDSLLKPIRDLAQNWSIDIARELEEYLDELGDIEISFGGDQSLNFAEAALLIQGSVCIYSKKVEYLHALVFKVMEMLAEKKASNGDEQDCEHVVDQELEDFDGGDDDDLPAVEIKVGKDLELECDLSSSSLLSRVGLLPVPPIELLALEHDEEYATSHSDQEYRLLNNCAVHRCGAILLDEAQRELLDNDLFAVEASTTMYMGSKVHVLPTVDIQFDAVDDFMVDPLGEVVDDDDDELDDEPGNWPSEEAHECQSVSAGNDAGVFYPETPNTPNTPMSMMTVAGKDPWAMEDPHTDTSAANRPFKFMPNPRVPSIPGKTDNSSEPLQLPTCPQSMRTAAFSDLSDAFEIEMSRRKRLRHRNRQNLGGQKSRNPYSQYAADVDDDDVDDVDDMQGDDDEPSDEPSEGAEPGTDEMWSEVNDTESAIVEVESVIHHESQRQIDAVDDFFASSQAYAQETELSQRIGEWTHRMEPLLVQQNCRPVFDMQIYGDRILTKLKEENATSREDTSSFKAVTSECEVWDVCRIFLASLQLAADRNIDIDKSVADGVISEDFGIKVLTLEAHRPSHHMDNERDTLDDPAPIAVVAPQQQRKIQRSKGLRFAAASPVICETYAADVYDRAYTQSPSSYVENSDSSASRSVSSLKSVANSTLVRSPGSTPDAKRVRKSLSDVNA